MVTQTPTRIGILGAPSTGATTLMRQIEMEMRARGITVARTSRLARRAAALGLPKMQQHTAISTEWIIATGIADELAASVTADVVLADRAAPDALAYYTAALEWRGEAAAPQILERLHQLVATQTPQYDLLIATVLDSDEPPVHHDGDPAYRALVDRHIHRYLEEHQLDDVLVTNDDASRDHAIRSALAELAGLAVAG